MWCKSKIEGKRDQIPEPSPKSALAYATPSAGKHSLIHEHTLRPIYVIHFTYIICLWIKEETHAPEGNPHRQRIPHKLKPGTLFEPPLSHYAALQPLKFSNN